MANSTGELLFDLVQTELKKKINDSFIVTYRVPIINKIQKIPVRTDIMIQQIKNDKGTIEWNGGIKITSSKIFYDDSCENMELYYDRVKLSKLSPKAIGVFLAKIKLDLEKIKFDKLVGRFVLPKGKIIIENIGIDVFGDTWSTAEECCVCYEKTYTKTSCEHYLCVECWSNIKKKSCPICREFLCAQEYSDSDSEPDY